MSTYTPVLASGSTNGRAILITATSSPGQLLHTVHATRLHELMISASNSGSSDVELTLEIGGTGAGDIVKQTIPSKQGEVRVLQIESHHRYTGSIEIRAFAGTGSVIAVSVNVNEIVP